MNYLKIIAFIIIIGCTGKKPENNELSQGSERDIQEGIQDVTYRQKEILNIDLSGYEKLDHKKVNTEGCLNFVEKESQLYLISQVSNGNIILNSSITGNSLYFVHENGSCIELTKDKCDLMAQNDEYELIHCEKTQAMFTGNKLLLTREIKNSKEFYSDSISIERDSITISYNLNDLTILDKDSIRFDY